MKKVTNLLRGVVEIRAEGAFPERLINLCAQHRVAFWGVECEEFNTFFLGVFTVVAKPKCLLVSKK